MDKKEREQTDAYKKAENTKFIKLKSQNKK